VRVGDENDQEWSRWSSPVTNLVALVLDAHIAEPDGVGSRSRRPVREPRFDRLPR
jgi:hypothetical protein